MSAPEKLLKMKVILDKQLFMVKKNCMLLQKQLHEGITKHELIKSTLKQYEDKLSNQFMPEMNAMLYKQTKAFNDNLRRALTMQSDILKDLGEKYKKENAQYLLLNKKIENLDDFIKRLHAQNIADQNKKEMLQNTDLFNQRK